jgi:hypothetical protein
MHYIGAFGLGTEVSGHQIRNMKEG